MYPSVLWNDHLRRFAQDDDAAQIIEYALLIAVVSIALVLALRGIPNGRFTDLVTRVSNCLKGSCSSHADD
ncbi:MAG: Flp family type IVb pilin [Comamonas sp.]|nr:Flp family type IVb pilin [Comamonas sp.]